MAYLCTRGGECPLASQAILRGIADNGGLYVPDGWPALSHAKIESLAHIPYPERAAFTLHLLLNDFSYDELLSAAQAAYAGFETPSVAPVVNISENLYILELTHGPTLAFKDMALQLLPRLTALSAKKQGEKREIAVLTATSGDTGKAALEGFKDVPGTSCTVFYPQGGVSDLQEKQMVTAQGANVHVIAVKGNFDDAQTGVKRLFTDPAFVDQMNRFGRVMSSANSINLGRLAPQVAYYLSACAELLKSGAITWETGLDVCVPTGNFGNILAAWYAKRMGAPIRRLICASNSNSVLTEFIQTGAYDRNRPFYKTISPSMDILISSNLERLLFDLAGNDPEAVSGWMLELKEKGRFDIGSKLLSALNETFACGYADDAQTRAEIRQFYRETDYVLDPHTAVASYVLRTSQKALNGVPKLLVSTASEYKFSSDVLHALTGKQTEEDGFLSAERLSAFSGKPLPPAIAALRTLPTLHHTVCSKEQMGSALLEAFQRG